MARLSQAHSWRHLSDATRRRLSCISPLSPAAVKILSLRRQDTNLREIAAIVNTDPALAASVLRLANSSLFGLRMRVVSVLHATALLGLERLRTITTTAALRMMVEPALHTPALRYCWRHSVACAWIGEQLAVSADLDGNMVYSAGLLHDIGRFAMLACWEREYPEFLQLPSDSAAKHMALEARTFGVDHVEVGAYLLEDWGLPEEFQEAARRHHAPVLRESPGVADLVASACTLANLIGYSATAVLDNPTPHESLPTDRDYCFHIADAINQLEIF